MLDTLKIELDQAVLVDTQGNMLTIERKWNLTMSELDIWYVAMIGIAEENGSVLNYVLTFFEDRPVAFYLDGIELQTMDLTDTEKSLRN